MTERVASVIDVLSRAVRDVEELRRKVAMVGGLATSLRAEPRTTETSIWPSPFTTTATRKS